MPVTSPNNKRIARNTAFLYIRMLVVMVVALYMSRVVLKVLGIEDYGIYNVIGGMVNMLAFFPSSLSNATQRFLNIELGRDDIIGARRIFNQSLLLYIVVGLLLVLICESAGLWYLEHKMVIPPSRMRAAINILHISVFTVFLGIIQVPYHSAIVAREQMSFYAYLGIFEVLISLCLVILLQWISADKLVVYGIMMGLVQFSKFLLYRSYCKKHFPECSFMFYWNWNSVRETMRFIGYNIFGCFAWSVGVSGSNILLNRFYGPVVNAARGIAVQVEGAIVSFTDGIMTAVKPQIIKSYAQGNSHYMFQLLGYSSKYAFWMMTLLSLPICFNTSHILALWLTEVPDYSVAFIQLLLVKQIISVLIPSLWITANATGKIKNQQLYGRMFTLSALPMSYLLLRYGIVASPTIVFWILVTTEIGYWVYCVYDIHRQTGMTFKYYFQQIILPGFKVLSVSVAILAVVGCFLPCGWPRLLILTGLNVLSVAVTAYLWGMGNDERQCIHKIISNYLRK